MSKPYSRPTLSTFGVISLSRNRLVRMGGKQGWRKATDTSFSSSIILLLLSLPRETIPSPSLRHLSPPRVASPGCYRCKRLRGVTAPVTSDRTLLIACRPSGPITRPTMTFQSCLLALRVKPVHVSGQGWGGQNNKCKLRTVRHVRLTTSRTETRPSLAR